MKYASKRRRVRKVEQFSDEDDEDEYANFDEMDQHEEGEKVDDDDDEGELSTPQGERLTVSFLNWFPPHLQILRVTSIQTKMMMKKSCAGS